MVEISLLVLIIYGIKHINDYPTKKEVQNSYYKTISYNRDGEENLMKVQK